MGVKDRPQCYFDVELNREPVGRIVFQLFSDVCPKTSKNFLCLCTGEKGTGKVTRKKLCYKGSTFHRVVKNFMIQGGDFTEGTGRGGESIYGGYFEDENFILKHDKAFLLSMANRGKNTNGSQFFITTKMAPHLDGVHVVFGLVISGFEVIKKIEGLKTDSASRPYADVRVVDCGQLITKSANDVLEGKRKRTSSINSNDSNFSSSESESEEKLKHRKRLAKSKPSKKKRKEGKKAKKAENVPSNQRSAEKETAEGESKPEEEKETGGKREKPVVRPEEIPPVPENRFLLRRDMPAQEDKTEPLEKEEAGPLAEQKPAVTKSGRKIRGRGTIRYHTPTRSKSRSTSVEERGGSETPPHWKVETKRAKVFPPQSPERWSKGDKLKERSSSKWDNRSKSPQSHSGELSSDQSSERSSQHRLPKKKKKAKHKKKAKKRKHGKKKCSKNKSREHYESEGEKSATSARRSRSRSATRSPSSEHRSSGRRRQRSSLSFSKSYSRSYTSSRSRSRGKSRSYSQSRSFSRSRSRSLSGSRSRSYSQSRSRSRSRYRSRSRSSSQSRSRSGSRYTSRSRSLSSRKRSFSRSPRKRKTTKLKMDAMMPVTGKAQDKKITPVPILPALPVAETVPVIPLSDSPPPSRWKPDQKPWKPSYIHIQEIKAKVMHSKPPTAGPAGDGFSKKTRTPKSIPEDVEEKSAHKTSHGGSSRSKSISRSRSRSSSRSRSRSAEPYRSKSSSCDRSDSEKDQKGGSSQKNSLDKEWKEYYSSLNRIKNLDKFILANKSQDGLSGSGKEVSSERSPDLSASLENKRERGNSEEPEAKRYSSLADESFKSRSEWDSDSDKATQSNAATEAQVVQSSTMLATGWDSDRDSENPADQKTFGSEKEEGEASSESDYEALKKTSKAVTELGYKVAAAVAAASSSCPSDDGAHKVVQPERKKSKKKAKRKHKHKRKGESKSSSHHGKDKAKKSKRKHQKLKETFHWQPPLEFDEEEEDDESKRERRSPGREVEENMGEDFNKNNQDSTDLNKKLVKEEKIQLRSKENIECTNHSDRASNQNSVKDQDSLDDMEICTPEHNVDIIEHPVTPDLSNTATKLTLNSTSKSSEVASTDGALPQSKDQPDVTSSSTTAGPQEEAPPGRAVINFKWKPLKRMAVTPEVNVQAVTVKSKQNNENIQPLGTQGVKMEIKSKNRVRPGSLFDEVRKTVRLNQRPRNQESSSEERSPSVGKDRGASRSPKKSSSASSHRSRSGGWSRSYSRSRSRSRSYSYSSRSRSRSRRTRRRRSRSRSSTYRSYSRHSRSYSRSPSRSHSHHHRRRSRSDSYDSYSSRSRSVSRRRGRRRSESYRNSERRTRSSRSSSRSSSRHRSHSRSSRYS
ncbi:NK-tumor recognition protein isoform X1 [Poecilia reticulata]|uniref:peptidylprolyl isomerase n=3 Tax=Poecilia reticulata TaxID=8081 RepID=A0A3P9Q8Y5_POERE|nr:PREDICTED: NK-tumor recognition protein isoform X1 [Poecilia reticulata]XP_008394442.1 PREDICTED: NK-tumor recognition protein isoform X1 [Poecilia reticulata]